jgi:3-dehydroquinate synthase
VAIGLVYAAEVARLAGRLAPDAAARHRKVLSAVGLPTTWASGVWPALRERMAVDKKNRGARLRLVILEDIGRPVLLEDPPEDLLSRAYAEVAG